MSDQDLFLMLVATNPVLTLERSDYGDEALLARIIAAGKPNRLNTPRIRRGSSRCSRRGRGGPCGRRCRGWQ